MEVKQQFQSIKAALLHCRVDDVAKIMSVRIHFFVMAHFFTEVIRDLQKLKAVRWYLASEEESVPTLNTNSFNTNQFKRRQHHKTTKLFPEAKITDIISLEIFSKGKKKMTRLVNWTRQSLFKL